MQFSCSPANEMAPQRLRALARYRHQVFVQRLGWQLGDDQGFEVDQFDHEETVHLVAEDDAGRIVGCARLLPTTGAYLLGDVFGALLNGVAVPRCAQIWELSRFACGRPDEAEGNGYMKYLAESLLLRALRFCQMRGIQQLLAVTTPAVERIMRRAGVEVQRLGPPVLHEGEPILACVIAVSERSMQELGKVAVAQSVQSVHGVQSVPSAQNIQSALPVGHRMAEVQRAAERVGT